MQLLLIFKQNGKLHNCFPCLVDRSIPLSCCVTFLGTTKSDSSPLESIKDATFFIAA